jgi:hypothetical protein
MTLCFAQRRTSLLFQEIFVEFYCFLRYEAPNFPSHKGSSTNGPLRAGKSYTPMLGLQTSTTQDSRSLSNQPRLGFSITNSPRIQIFHPPRFEYWSWAVGCCDERSNRGVVRGSPCCPMNGESGSAGTMQEQSYFSGDKKSTESVIVDLHMHKLHQPHVTSLAQAARHALIATRDCCSHL